jgi:aspartyl/asparaginyl beta-hydroxylase (cupin superfamily)
MLDEVWLESNTKDVIEQLERMLSLPSWKEIEFAKVNWLMQHWLIGNGRYNAVLPVPPSLCELRLHKQDILREYLAYVARTNNALPRYSEVDPVQAIVTDADPSVAWRVVHLRIYDRDTEVIDQFPNTMEALSIIEHDCPTVMFSVLEPGKHIPTHTGFYCGVLRYHLGLIVPSSSFIEIDGTAHKWDPDIVFDDTFCHSVSNPSPQNRVVLFLDVVRNMGDERIDALNKRVIAKARDCDLVVGDVKRVNDFHRHKQTQRKNE